MKNLLLVGQPIVAAAAFPGGLALARHMFFRGCRPAFQLVEPPGKAAAATIGCPTEQHSRNQRKLFEPGRAEALRKLKLAPHDPADTGSGGESLQPAKILKCSNTKLEQY